MRLTTFAPILLLAATVSASALSYEGGKREVVDAGVHQPVLTKPPELVQFVQAAYPKDAEAQGLQGLVKLLVTISEDGSVADVAVAEPAGNGFDEAAIAAVKQFRFTPAEVDNVPAPIQIEYVYHFTLSPPEPPKVEIKKPPEATLKGEVVARGSRKRVPGAVIACGDAADAPTASSDGEGKFSLQATPPSCAVRIVAPGFQKFTTDEPLVDGETKEVVYHLMPKAIGFESIVRATREKKEVVRRTLGREELQRVPGSFGDPIRVLQNLPGVARAPFISGALIVRGASPDQTSTLLDGVPIPILFHLGGGPSILNEEFLDRIDFYPGGFGARWGRAIGGVVDVATRRGATDTWHGSVKTDFLDSGFFVEAPLAEGVSAAAAARRSYIDVFLPFFLPNDPATGVRLILPAYWDYQVRVDFGQRLRDGLPPRDTFYLMAFGSDDQLKAVMTGGGRNTDLVLTTRTLFHRLKGDWTHRAGNITSVFAPYAGYDRASIDANEIGGGGDSYTLGAREDLRLEISDIVTARTGFDIYFNHLKGDFEFPATCGIRYRCFPGGASEGEIEPYSFTVNAFDGAVFLETDLTFGPVTVTPGIRYSYLRLLGRSRNAWDPRLWIRWEPLASTSIKGSVGLYQQPPSRFDVVPGLGNPEIFHEKAFQASAGFEHRFTPAISLDVTGYFNRRYDLVDSPSSDDPKRLRVPPFVENVGLGRAYGLEVMLRHDVTEKLFGWIAYTLNRSEERTARSEDPYVVTTWDQTHILTGVVSYRLPAGFEIGARFRYVTGRPYTPILHEGDFYDADGNRFRGQTGDPRSARYSSFNQLDIRLDKNFVFKHWTLGAYIDVQNVYNALNTEALTYDYRYRETIEIPGIPFLPVLGLKGKF